MKININNIEKVNSELDKIQARCTARLCSVVDILQAIKTIEQRLNTFKIRKKDWKGMKFICNPYLDQFPGAYKGSPEGTMFELTRCASGWFITRLNRRDCRGNAKYAISFSNVQDYKHLIEW